MVGSHLGILYTFLDALRRLLYSAKCKEGNQNNKELEQIYKCYGWVSLERRVGTGR